MIKQLTIGAAATMAIFATPAFANTQDPPTQSIDVRGLDLGTAEGQKMLDQQIERAARAVCDVNQVRTGTRIRSSKARQCLKEARASARKQVAAMIENNRQGG